MKEVKFFKSPLIITRFSQDLKRLCGCSYIFFLQENRLIRMNQAAELYLTQIVEKKSMVGLVTFDQKARIQNYLTKIIDSSDYPKITANLPQQASNGTSICSGIEAGFQVIF